MKQKILKTVSILLMVLGVIIFLYPDIATLLQDYRSDQYIEEFENLYQTDEKTASDNADDPNNEDRGERPFQDLYNAILEYNQNIYETGQKDFKDAWCYTQSPVNIDCLENDLFGYIEVPSMDVKLPLYIGASVSNMAKGATVMGQTSIPIGGVNTNSVIAGHRGYGGSPYFRYIENLKLGDYVYITNPWETLTYQAVKISIISPYDSDAVKIQEGKDMVTLLTCHPYASGGKYRYLVFCERVQNDSSNAPSLPVNWEELNKEPYVISENGEDVGSSVSFINAEKNLRRICAGVILVIIILAVKKKPSAKGEKRN